MTDSSSDTIAGRYRVLGTLGKGAMGLVFMAYDPVLERKVAIKQMTAEIADNQELRQRFYIEARAAARLNHPNIITVHELQESGGDIFMIMEMVEGKPLSAMIQAKPVPLSIEATLDVMAQVCDGLDYAHQRAIVHRDIKPANLFLTPSGTIKILDFGIARFGSLHMTQAGALVGTPDYMAPEQIRGDEIDRRTDLWAVGAVLYQLLSGTKPFEGKPLARLLGAIAQTPHVPLLQRAPSVPKAVSDLVDRLLSKPREGRPASAGVVRDELRAILGRESSASTKATLTADEYESTLLVRPPAFAPPVVPPVAPVPVPEPAAARPAAPEFTPPSDSMTRTATGREPVLIAEAGDATAPVAPASAAPKPVAPPAAAVPPPLPAVAAVPSPSKPAPEHVSSLPPVPGTPAKPAPPVPGRAASPAPTAALPSAPAANVAPAATARPGAAAPAPAAVVATGVKKSSSTPLVVAALGAVVVLVGIGGAAWWYSGRPSSAGAPGDQGAVTTASGQAPSAPAATQAPPTEPPAAPPVSPAGEAVTPPTATSVPNVPPAPPTPLASAAQPSARVAPVPAKKAPVASTPAASTPTASRPPGVPAGATRGGDPSGESGASAAPTVRPGLSGDTVDAFKGRSSGQGDQGVADLAAVNRINYVLGQYVQALVNGDAEAIREFRPSPSSAEVGLLRARQLKVRLEGVRIEVNGNDAVARCRRKVEGVSATGSNIQEDGPVTFQMTRRPAGWVITEIR